MKILKFLSIQPKYRSVIHGLNRGKDVPDVNYGPRDKLWPIRITPVNVLVMHIKPKRISLILLNIESKNSVLLWDGTSRDIQILIFSSRSIWLAWAPFEHLFAESSSPEHQKDRTSNIEPCEYWLCGKSELNRYALPRGLFQDKNGLLNFKFTARGRAGRVGIGLPGLGQCQRQFGHGSKCQKIFQDSINFML